MSLGLRVYVRAFLAILLPAMIWGTWRHFRYELIAKNFAVVEPNFLYRSGQLSARLVQRTLQKNDIQLVVALLDYDKRKAEHRAQRQAVAALGIEQINLHLRGNGTGDIRHYAEAIAAIARAKREQKHVLVHCAAGARRTGGVIATYLALVENMPSETAYRELDRYGGHSVAESALLPYLNANMETLAQLLVEKGVIPRVPDPLPQFQPPSLTRTESGAGIHAAHTEPFSRR